MMMENQNIITPVLLTITRIQPSPGDTPDVSEENIFSNNGTKINVTSIDHNISKNNFESQHIFGFSKPIDKFTPFLGKAIVTGEVFNMMFDFHQPAGYGNLRNIYSIELNNAVLEKITILYPHTQEKRKHPEEMIYVTYESIIWHHHNAIYNDL